MQIVSTKMFSQENEEGKSINPEISQLELESIFAPGYASRLKNLLIVSAFTDVEYIDQIVDEMRKREYASGKKHLAIYLDSSASRYYSDESQRNAMNKCARRIRDARNLFDDESGIYLVSCGALFHSKFIISESNTDCRIIFGSINFTKKAFEKNEELALSFDAPLASNTKINRMADVLKKYVLSLNSQKISSDSTELIEKGKTSREVLMNGSLYREIKEQDPFRINLNLPNDYLDDLSNRKKNVDDFLNFLESKTQNSLPLLNVINEAKIGKPLYFDNDRKRKRRSWKNFSLETCFGHWVPLKYVPEVEKCLKEACGEKIGNLVELPKLFKENEDVLRKAFVSLMQKIQNDRAVNRLGVWMYDNYDADSLKRLWGGWIEKITNKLTDSKFEDYRKRLCMGVTHSCVPDMWDDPISSETFENSICDTIKYYISTKEKVSKKICNEISFLLKCDEDESFDIEKVPNEKIIETLCQCKFES